jgi:predicted nucleic acid-binding protein
MIIVSDTGPLISLIQLDQLSILTKLYPDYILPKAVFDELVLHKTLLKNDFDLIILQEHVKIVSIKMIQHDDIHSGELECIALFQEFNATRLLIDARHFAEQLNIPCFGTIGLLLEAKSKGLIVAIKPLIEQMKANGRFISDKLLQSILIHAKEI